MAAAVPMEEEFRGPPTPVVERYFTTYYAVGESSEVLLCIIIMNTQVIAFVLLEYLCYSYSYRCWHDLTSFTLARNFTIIQKFR